MNSIKNIPVKSLINQTKQEFSKNHFDLLVLGGGSGGVASARWASEKLNKRVALIENKKLGGTCVNVGCVPKKVMYAASSHLDDTNYTDLYGINNQNIKVDWPTLVKNRDSYVERLNGIYENMLKNSKVEFINGTGSFVDNKTIMVDCNTFTADHILISTGSQPIMPKSMPGIEYCISSDGFFQLKECPKRTLVIGGGYVGTELTQILNSLGSKVTQIVLDEILRFLDEDVRQNLIRNMKFSGVDFRIGHGLKEVKKNDDGSLQGILSNGEKIDCDVVLMAIGRRPNIESLNLEKTGIQLDKMRNIQVDEYQNTSVDNIYAVGDVTGQLALTPVAIKAGRILVERLFDNKPNLKMDYENVPTVVFTHPPTGAVGLSEQQAIEKYGKDNIVTYKSEFYNMFHSLQPDFEKREKALFKLICLKEGEKIIGIQGNGRGIDEMMQGLGIAMKMGATKRDFEQCVAIHPTASEEFVLMNPQYN